MTGNLNDIITTPDSIVPRLEYADSLGDHNHQEYAGFIRLQCQLANPDLSAIDRRKLERQTKEILQEHGETWLKELEFPEYVVAALWRMGFVDDLVIDMDRFNGGLDQVLELAPISTLSISDEEDSTGWQVLRDDPGLRRIRHLDLTDAALDRAGAEALFSSSYFDSLESIAFSDDDCQPDVIREFILGSFPSLRHIRFAGYVSANRGNEILRQLSTSELSQKLKVLELFNLSIDAEGSETFAAPNRFSQLNQLSLAGGQYSRNRVSAVGAKTMAGTPNLANLQLLDLGFNDIGDDGFEAIAKSAFLPQLEQLYLQANAISHDSLVYLSIAKFLHQLRVLDLSHNTLCDRSVETLVLAAPANLTTLWLYHNDIGDRGTRMLANAPMARNLAELNLAQTGMTDEGAQSLLDSDNLPDLETLYLGQNLFSSSMKSKLVNHFGAVLADLKDLDYNRALQD